MAEAVSRNETVGDAAVPGGEPAALLPRREEPELLVTPPRRTQPPPHAGRFLFAYAVLGAIIGAAAIGFAVLALGGESASARWSAWQPETDGSERVREIAEHVAAGYRLPSGRQLVAAIPRAPTAVDPPVIAIALDSQALFGSEEQFKTYEMDNGLMFFLCGTGEECTIPEGEPSIERHRLLRREALELALYTFRYMEGVDSIVTFLPPRAPEQQQQGQAQAQETEPTTAVYFRRSELEPLVDQPLTQTLRGRPVSEQLSKEQQRTVDRLTLPALFRFSFQPAPDGQSSILILSPFAQTS